MPFANAEDRRAYQRAYFRPRRLAEYRANRHLGLCGKCGVVPTTRFANCNRCRDMAARANRDYRLNAWGNR
jgi:hypothetical protein